LPPLSDSIALAVVTIGVAAAAVIDLRTRRVPNVLTASLVAIGIGLSGAGFGRVGLGASLLGVVIGVACMLPGHLFGATGAGDVKLLGAAGALLGPVDIVKAFIGTAIAGGVVALVVALRRGLLRNTFGAVARLVSRRSENSGGGSSAVDSRFAYAPAIAIGVVVAVFGW